MRRSFRDKYLADSTTTAAEAAKHLPIWFVDVTGDGGVGQPETTTTAQPAAAAVQPNTAERPYRSLTYMEFAEPNPVAPVAAENPRATGAGRVNRSNTFKVERAADDVDDDVERQRRRPALQRRETFKVHDGPSIVEVQSSQPPAQLSAADATAADVASPASKGYYLSRYRQHVEPSPPPMRPTWSRSPSPAIPTTTTSAKLIPVGIAVPYNSNDDRRRSAGRAERQTPTPPLRLRRQKRTPSPAPPPQREQRPHAYSSATFTRKPKANDGTTRPYSMGAGGVKATSPPPAASRISFDALRKPAEAPRDSGPPNLGFDRFYDPNYFVPANRNLFGPLATAQLRAVNVVVQPTTKTAAAQRKHWY